MNKDIISIDIISAGDVKKIISNREELIKYQIVDLRERREYKQFHLYNSVNIEYEMFMELSDYSKMLDKKRIIILYCDMGGRSIYAARRLAKYGYNVRSLSGGISEYIKTNQSGNSQSASRLAH
jgi:rhodanese-related sulfurtransferase